MTENSPEHLRRAAENSLAALREYRAAAPGLFVELAEAGHPVETVNELWDSATPEVLDILLEWLPKVANPALTPRPRAGGATLRMGHATFQ